MAENEDGQEKSEQPSGKRLEDAREEGNVAKSTELNSVAVIVAALIVFKMFSGFFGRTLGGYLRFMYSQSSLFHLTSNSLTVILAKSMQTFALVVGPIILGALFLAIVSNVGQVGFMISPKALKPKFDKLNVYKGLKQLVSSKAMVELVKGVLKIFIIGYIGYLVVTKHYAIYLVLPHHSVLEIAGFLGDLLYEITYKVAIALFVLAIGDFAYQRYENIKGLKMTKQEVKEESKQAEGDPLVKGKIRQAQQNMARNRMMGDVPEATVVVTNPTHYAVALKYDLSKKEDAPRVVAKGKNLIAQKIKKIAAENEIPVIENRPLARSLFASCDVGSEIPGELFQAVAEVLSQVYQADRTKYRKMSGALNG